jgi:hypothetical protein
MRMFGRTKERSLGPSVKHPFVAPSDPRSGLAGASVQDGLQQTSQLAVTAASLRVARCAMKGCGKARQDAIHEPAT